MLLALDTATAYVTVCLYDDTGDETGDETGDDTGDDTGGRVLAERHGIGPQQHGERLAPAIEEVLAEAGVDRTALTGIVVGVGPGPYTGLRVGLVTARVLGLALGVPVRGVGSLDALALGAVGAGVAEPFVATLDARRKELFWASYDDTGRRLDGPHVAKPADLPVASRLVVGAGADLYPGAFERTAGPRDPRAADLARIAARRPERTVDPEPVYLRRPDAVVPGPPRPVSPRSVSPRPV